MLFIYNLLINIIYYKLIKKCFIKLIILIKYLFNIIKKIKKKIIKFFI